MQSESAEAKDSSENVSETEAVGDSESDAAVIESKHHATPTTLHPPAPPRSHLHPDIDDDDDDLTVFDDFHFTHLVIAALLTLVVILIKGVVVAELFNFISPRLSGRQDSVSIRWTTGMAIAILADILF
jgi:hypothetical protein